MNSFGDYFNPLLSNGAIWTSMSNGNHHCRLSNKNYRRSIACNVKLLYNSKWGYEGIKRYISFSKILKEVKSVVVVRLQQLVPDFLI